MLYVAIVHLPWRLLRQEERRVLERACQDLPDHSISRAAKNRVHDGQTKQAIDSFEATVKDNGSRTFTAKLNADLWDFCRTDCGWSLGSESICHHYMTRKLQ